MRGAATTNDEMTVHTSDEQKDCGHRGGGYDSSIPTRGASTAA